MSDSSNPLLDALRPKIDAWCRDTFGAGAEARGARSLGGHSGVTIGFDVRRPAGAGDPALADSLVLKIAPPGVRRQNSFDVLRQVPVLRALERAGVPAPVVRFASDDETHFGGPYLMMSLLRGASLPDVFGADAGCGVVNAPALFAQAVQVLAKIHSVPLSELAGWNAERPVAQEIDHWITVVSKSTDARWVQTAQRVRELLHRHAPADPVRGLVHGDYYSNNWVFDGPRLSGVVDWEGSSIGPSLLDLGWLCMMYDEESWGPLRRALMGWSPRASFFVSEYARHRDADLARLPWYQALAGYRLACISAYYFERHKTGKRPNPAWDVLGDAFMPLMARSEQLVGASLAGSGLV